jgi:tRNA U34 2-thiouridine synthase MnmA/TrmU
MSENQSGLKALCLVSGGLDSALSARLMQEQNIGIIALHFANPFGSCGEREDGSPPQRVAESLGVELLDIPFEPDYLDVISHPCHGYGSNVNPCIDCRIYMLRQARKIMDRLGASFVVTGEVVGQRPMSQRLNTMRCIEKASTLEGYLVRPLSAKLLAPTIPEEKGWISREDLLAISGRSRKELMRLAEEKGLSGYASPGGGCLLTDPRFAEKMRDTMSHDKLTQHAVSLLKVGRHFRLPFGSKLVIGRNEAENESLIRLAEEQDTLLDTVSSPGPIAILQGGRASEEEELAARMVARYSDGKSSSRVTVSIKSPEGTKTLEVEPMNSQEVGSFII